MPQEADLVFVVGEFIHYTQGFCSAWSFVCYPSTHHHHPTLARGEMRRLTGGRSFITQYPDLGFQLCNAALRVGVLVEVRATVGAAR